MSTEQSYEQNHKSSHHQTRGGNKPSQRSYQNYAKPSNYSRGEPSAYSQPAKQRGGYKSEQYGDGYGEKAYNYEDHNDYYGNEEEYYPASSQGHYHEPSTAKREQYSTYYQEEKPRQQQSNQRGAIYQGRNNVKSGYAQPISKQYSRYPKDAPLTASQDYYYYYDEEEEPYPPQQEDSAASIHPRRPNASSQPEYSDHGLYRYQAKNQRGEDGIESTEEAKDRPNNSEHPNTDPEQYDEQVMPQQPHRKVFIASSSNHHSRQSSWETDEEGAVLQSPVPASSRQQDSAPEQEGGAKTNKTPNVSYEFQIAKAQKELLAGPTPKQQQHKIETQHKQSSSFNSGAGGGSGKHYNSTAEEDNQFYKDALIFELPEPVYRELTHEVPPAVPDLTQQLKGLSLNSRSVVYQQQPQILRQQQYARPPMQQQNHQVEYETHQPQPMRQVMQLRQVNFQSDPSQQQHFNNNGPRIISTDQYGQMYQEISPSQNDTYPSYLTSTSPTPFYPAQQIFDDSQHQFYQQQQKQQMDLNSQSFHPQQQQQLNSNSKEFVPSFKRRQLMSDQQQYEQHMMQQQQFEQQQQHIAYQQQQQFQQQQQQQRMHPYHQQQQYQYADEQEMYNQQQQFYHMQQQHQFMMQDKDQDEGDQE